MLPKNLGIKKKLFGKPELTFHHYLALINLKKFWPPLLFPLIFPEPRLYFLIQCYILYPFKIIFNYI